MHTPCFEFEKIQVYCLFRLGLERGGEVAASAHAIFIHL